MRSIDTRRNGEDFELLQTPRFESHGTRNALLVGGVLVALAIGAAMAIRSNDTVGTEPPVASNSNSSVPATAPAPPRPAVASTITIPQGTSVTISLNTRLTTKESRVGDAFSAVVAQSVMAEGRTAIPAGARVNGQVIVSEQPGKASGRGKMQLQFSTVEFNNRSYDLGSRSALFRSESGKEKDIGLIGGGAAAGGVVGAILGKDPESAAKGAVIGGAAGTAVSLMTRGPQLEFEPGTKIRFTLDQPVAVRPPSNQPS